VQELNECIEATAVLEAGEAQLLQKIKDNRERIRELLEALNKKAHATPNRYAAELVAVARREWDVPKLARLLSAELFEALCPRRPEAGKLAKLLEADEVLAPKLSQCVALSETQRLEILAPPAAAAAVAA
jgi:hypothetical protein